MECAVAGADWIGPRLIAGLACGLEAGPDEALLDIYKALQAVVRVRSCFAHLLQPVPRTPEKWIPFGLKYVGVAARRVC